QRARRPTAGGRGVGWGVQSASGGASPSDRGGAFTEKSGSRGRFGPAPGALHAANGKLGLGAPSRADGDRARLGEAIDLVLRVAELAQDLGRVLAAERGGEPARPGGERRGGGETQRAHAAEARPTA